MTNESKGTIIVRLFWCFLLTSILGLDGCAVDTGLNDGTWQATGKVSEASLSLSPDGAAQVDFVFEYLLGLVDDEGIEVVTWNYALTDSNRRPFGSVTEPMRQFKEGENSPLFVEGTRTRTLEIDEALNPSKTYVLWIKVFYRDTILHERLVPLALGVPYFDNEPLDDLREFSIGQ